jgi:dTDP-4-dehydrorhamnose reductase
MSKEILITGGQGVVGGYFEDYENILITGKNELDITKPEQVESFIKKTNPKAIIHLAAETNVDLCEDNPDMAYKIQTIGTYNTASVCRDFNITMVYVSTGGVFEGKRGKRKPYTTTDTPNPVNVYARSKWLGEMITKDIVPNHIIARSGWIFGGFEKDNKFIGFITKQILDGEKVVRAVTDTKGCPTYGKDFAKEIIDLLNEKQQGLFHLVNKGSASRYEIAQEIALNLDRSVDVLPAKTTDFPSFHAPRPSFEVIEQNRNMRSWKNALADYLQEWKKNMATR